MRGHVWLLVLPLAALAACSGEDRPAAGGGSSSGVSGGGGSSGGGGAGNGGGRPDGGAALCDAVPQEGANVAELQVLGSAPPALGGALRPGTYVLTEAAAYLSRQEDAGDGGEANGSGGPTGNSARATIVVTGTTLAMTASRGSTAALPADTMSVSTYTVEGTALRTTSVCPGAGAQRTIAFSAVGGGLAIFTDASHREVYSRK